MVPWITQTKRFAQCLGPGAGGHDHLLYSEARASWGQWSATRHGRWLWSARLKALVAVVAHRLTRHTLLEGKSREVGKVTNGEG